ncbi:MAG: hypothetical protein K9N55_00485 [Phycisphaerae bacterium]|nr:hypothetical protein [Phycisphaerae bacterium]
MYKWLYRSLFICLAVSGCASQSTKNPLSEHYYLNPETDVTRLGPTVFLELTNRSEFSRISVDATDALFQAIQQQGLFGMSVIREGNAHWESLDLGSFEAYTLEQLGAIRETLHSDAVLSGSITAYTPYPHLLLGLRLKLVDLKSGETLWAFDHIWDTADSGTQKRLQNFYTQKNLLGLPESRDRLGSVSSLKFLKFVAHETSQTLGPKK